MFGSEIFALDCDADRDAYLGNFPGLLAWLQRLRSRSTYATTHKAWNAVVPPMIDRLKRDQPASSDPSWVADACERALS